MIRFPCPRCDAPLKAPAERAGERITCPECERAVAVPDSLGDEPPAVERDTRGRRKALLWGCGALALASIAVVAVVAAVVIRSGPDDGLTRAERAELEAKMKRDLPGSWEEAYLTSTTAYTFTDDGRFEAVRYEGGKKKIGGHVGTWSVSGSRMRLRVTESADDHVKTGPPFEMAISDVKSENGKVLKFKISRSGGVSESRTLTRQPEPAPKADPPGQQPPPPTPKKDDGLTDDQRLTKWLPGQWTSQVGQTVWEWRFQGLGFYDVKVLHGGQSVGSFSGQWFVRAGHLTLTVDVSFYEPIPANSAQTYVASFATPTGFILSTPLNAYFTTLGRKK